MHDDHDAAHLARHALAGVGAGLVGTAVMVAMRSFDQRYAPKTVPKAKQDPGAFLVRHAERAVPGGHRLPPGVEHDAILATHLTYGSTFGLIYALLDQGPLRHKRNPLLFGPMLGMLVWAVGHVGLLPGLGLETPAWKQSFPEVTGELFREVAYGVAVAAAYGAIHDAL